MQIELGKIKKQSREDFINERDVVSEYYFIKKMILNSNIYPTLKIDQLDLCPNGKEEFNVWLKIEVTLKKDQLFELLKVANSSTDFELGGEEFLSRVTIETFPRKEDLENI